MEINLDGNIVRELASMSHLHYVFKHNYNIYKNNYVQYTFIFQLFSLEKIILLIRKVDNLSKSFVYSTNN